MQGEKSKGSGLQGLIRLISDATVGVTDLVEDMHHQVVRPPVLPSTPILVMVTNVAGFTYNSVRWSTRFISGGLDKILGQLTPLLGDLKTTDQREAIHAALNGIVGDYLEAKDNPLQIKMQVRYQAEAIPLNCKSIEAVYPSVNGKILLMVHGSCMNDIQWAQNGHNHGAAIARELDMTPIYLHYNSGRHISLNGRSFNELLEGLVLSWPVPVEELVIIAHSMGGLVTRSAMYYGQQQQKTWTEYLAKVVFLGTPHHGAPLERIGNYLDVMLENIPYAKPFARLGKIRSAGVTDLRYGNLIDEDWQDNDRFEIQGDKRNTIPLSPQIACYSIAAVIEKEQGAAFSQMLGDRLVDVKSALGQHQDPAKNLDFKAENTWVAYENTHLDLLNNPEVYDKIKSWLV